jgi:hypothetical protein
MTIAVQVTFDCHDPHRQARFWADALGYEKEFHDDFVRGLVDSGQLPEDQTVDDEGHLAFAVAAACSASDGTGPRLYFQQVEENKEVKNRVHLDLAVGAERREEEVTRLEALGATRLWTSDDRGPFTQTMADPEGNEFCVA